MKTGAKLRWVARMYYGDSLATDDRNEGDVPVMGSNGVFDWHDRANLEGPCIIVGRKGSHGKINWSDTAAWVTDTAFGIDSTMTDADLRWLYYALQTLPLEATSQDTGVPGLSREKAYEMRLDVPSLAAQRRVADMLDAETARIDTLIKKTTEVLAVVDRRRTAALGRALSVDGTLTPLRYLVAAPIGGVWGGDPGTSDVDVRVFRGADVDRVNHLLRGDPPVRSISSTEASSRLLQPGDILVEKSGGGEKTPVGVPAIVDEEALSEGPAVPSNFCARLVPNEINSTFLAQALSALYRSGATWPILRQSTGIQNLSLRDLLGLCVPKPAEEVQVGLAAEIQEQVSNCERMETLIHRQIDLLETRRRSLITAAVTGRITV